MSTALRKDESALRVLVFSSLFPSAARPRHGIFVETRLRKIRAAGNLDARVVAPVPWFPFRHRSFGRYAEFAATPGREEREGIEVLHPRYAMLPKIGAASQPHAMALAGMHALRALRRSGFDCDVIDAHYFYPDGVAAGIIARWTGKPFIVTARGSDLNVLARKPSTRTRIVETALRAKRVLCVSAALRERALEIGIPGSLLEVSRNGVDTTMFDVRDRAQSRRRLGLPFSEPILVCVGNLVPEKGHDLAIEALSLLDPCRLLVIGEGPQREHLELLAKRHGVIARVSFMRSMPQEALVDAYAAADVLVHPSLREGWPNVVLEALACGTPVVATLAGGIREIVRDGTAGMVVEDRSAETLVRAIRSLLGAPPAREAVRQCATSLGWSSVAKQCVRVLADAAQAHTTNATENRRCAT
ncbi:MAG TPA: glycosyltransferase [Casimicrobiaceae bacterium]|nr:glycosyltransferase [Casimicrobiaceae bacterium]